MVWATAKQMYTTGRKRRLQLVSVDVPLASLRKMVSAAATKRVGLLPISGLGRSSVMNARTQRNCIVVPAHRGGGKRGRGDKRKRRGGEEGGRAMGAEGGREGGRGTYRTTRGWPGSRAASA